MENDIFEVNNDNHGYTYIERIDEVLLDVECEYGAETKSKVENWLLESKEGEQLKLYEMIITNLGE